MHLQLHLHLWKAVVLPGITIGQTDPWPDAQNSATQSPKAQAASPRLAANVTSMLSSHSVCERVEGTEGLLPNQSMF